MDRFGSSYMRPNSQHEIQGDYRLDYRRDSRILLARKPVLYLVQRLQSIVSLESNKDRVEHFEIGIKMIKDRPLTGFGIGNISRVANDFREPPKETAMAFLHNVFLEVAVTTGIPGLIILVALIGGLIFIGVKCTVLAKAPLELCVVFAMIVAQLVHLQVDMILLGAAAMPLGFIPVGILLRYCSTNRHILH